MRCRFEDWDAPVRIVAADDKQAWVIHENSAMPIAFACDLDSLHAPDPDDGATKGALLDAVREAWKDPGIHAEPVNVGPPLWWHVYSGDSERRIGGGASEFAALEAARQAAP